MNHLIHPARALGALVLAAALFFFQDASAQARINVNTASEAELTTLSGIGPARARAIIEHREQHGPFTSVDALTQVRGIGPGILARIRDQVTVGDGSGPAPAPETTTPQEPSPPPQPDAPQAQKLPPRPADTGDDDFDLDLTQDDPRPSASARQAALAARQADASASQAEAPSSGASSPATGASPPPPAGGLINLNTADEATLTRLPGIGPARAQAIIAHRSSNGPFRSVAQVTDVSGIGPATLRNMENLVTVQVDLNTAGLAELEAIGLDQDAAERLIAWRAESGPFRSVAQLTEVPGFGRGALETLKPFVRVDAP